MGLDDLFEDMFERDENKSRKRKYGKDETDYRKNRYDDKYQKTKEGDEEPRRKRGLLDRLGEIFD